MANNSMGTKKVEELLVSKSMPLGMQFYVPNYQRGYRWKESQVQQLLNDIKEFDYEKNNNKTMFACLFRSADDPGRMQRCRLPGYRQCDLFE